MFISRAMDAIFQQKDSSHMMGTTLLSVCTEADFMVIGYHTSLMSKGNTSVLYSSKV